ncbi:MAG: TIGR01212 family radical SAM protein [Firmicutes bacterium]|nr:TIGR01212 family radical SAM protein [Bacillota bacterium]
MTASNHPIIFDTSDGQQLRVNMIGSWLKRRFGRKIVKLSIDGGFTCPNRDGSKGSGGCLFCSGSGSGDMASSIESAAGIAAAKEESGQADFVAPRRVRRALDDQIGLLSGKWPQAGYIAYFQSHTNTYAPAQHLRALFTAAADQPDVIGLAIATRSDCLSEEVLDLLEELNRRTFLWVELGLQTIHGETARAMNLCHTLADYDSAAARLHSRGIRIVTHLILGLPGESRQMMLDSVRYVCQPLQDGNGHSRSLADDPSDCCPEGKSAHLFGLKLHMLNVVRSSALSREYPGYVPFDSIDDYTDFVIEALELVPPDVTIHRISGDAPRSDLIAPEWSWRKRTILNEIHRKMRLRDTWQGRMTGITGIP